MIKSMKSSSTHWLFNGDDPSISQPLLPSGPGFRTSRTPWSVWRISCRSMWTKTSKKYHGNIMKISWEYIYIHTYSVYIYIHMCVSDMCIYIILYNRYRYMSVYSNPQNNKRGNSTVINFFCDGFN